LLRWLEEEGKDVVHLEHIQDLVIKALHTLGYHKTEIRYAIYRYMRQQARTSRAGLLDVNDVIENYIKDHDWRVWENANIGFGFGGLLLHSAGAMIANYVLNYVYPEEISNAHREGFFHIHDLSMGITGYCCGHSLRDLLLKGFGGVEGKTSARPPRHFGSALLQMVNYIGTLQNEWAGAQAFNNVDTLLAPYIRADRLSYEEVKQEIQQFVFNLNVTSRWGGQSPFTNITLDFTIPGYLRREAAIGPGGTVLDATYGDYQKEVNMINRAFLEVMLEGDAQGRIFPFPIPTYNVTKEFCWDSENSNLLFEMTAKYGIPYFQNFINSVLRPEDIRSMCCRLSMDLRQLKYKTGGLFASGDTTGSIGVVTLNMPRLAYLSRGSEERFFSLIEHYMNIAKESLEIKRKLLERNLNRGLFPFTKRYLPRGYSTFFSTIGLVGMNEACLNLIGKDIATEEGKNLAAAVLSFMRKKIVSFQQETGNLYNLEATPAEGSSYRLAKIDKKEFPQIKTAGTDESPYYTNSTQLPVSCTDDVVFALGHQEGLQSLYTGGTVFHLFLGERLPNGGVCKLLVKRILENYRIPYLSITPTFSVCPRHGYISGEHSRCPECGQECEVYSRVVGYYRPVKNWNEGKRQEFRERKTFRV